MKIAEYGALLVAATALLAPKPAQAQAASWTVDGSGSRCTLSRPLDGPEPTTLIIRAVPTTEKYELLLVREDWPRRFASTGRDLQVTFQPGSAVHEGPVGMASLGAEIGSAIGAYDFPRSLLEDFGRSDAMKIAVGERDLGTYSYPGAARAVQAFELCVVAKLIEWGADPAAFEPGAQLPKPVGDPAEWLLGDNPQKRLGFAAHGGVRAGVARLSLDTDGHVEACELVESTKDSFAASACGWLKAAARYEPARDKEGNPIRSVMLVTWDHWWRDEPAG